MKIETKVLEGFLSKIRMGEIDSCLLDFRDDGLFVNVMGVAQVSSVNGLLNKSAFDEYTAIGRIGVDNLGKIIQIFKRLVKNVDITIEGNLLSAKGASKELKFSLVDEKFIGEPKPSPDLKHDTSFIVPATTITEFFKDVQSNKDTSIMFETVENGVKMYNSGKYVFTYNIESEGTVKGTHVRMGSPLIDALSEIKEGNIKFNVSTDYPLIAEIKTDNYYINYLVAPRVDND